MKSELEPVIGLEIHLQLKTKSKMFCNCKNEWLEESPNINICPVCLGHPGSLPSLNKNAVRMALELGLSLGGRVINNSEFARKNYFYPDLPKGYQISQYEVPLIDSAHLDINEHRIRIKRLHLEEDTAKLIHAPNYQWSLLDFNRAGIPLLEIVTEPDFQSPEEAKTFLRELQLIVRYLNISEADMEKGQMRCDTNISVRPTGDKSFYAKAEIKNLNSFKAVEDSLKYEIARQSKLWQEGKPLKINTTYGWEEQGRCTVAQRNKEGDVDYRYFPEPDIPRLSLEDFNIDLMIKDLIELPQARRKRFIETYGFGFIEARILTDDPYLAHFTEKAISELRAWLLSLQQVEGSRFEAWEKEKARFIKLVGNWLINRLTHLMLKNNTIPKDLKITPENFAEFIVLIYEGKISSTLAQQLLEKMFFEGSDVDRAMRDGSLTQIDDQKALTKLIDKIIKNNPKVVADYQKGKSNAMAFLVGQIMKETHGRAHVDLVKKILSERL